MLLFAGGAGMWAWFIRMPGATFEGPLPGLPGGQAHYVADLKAHVEELGGKIGARNSDHHEALGRAAVHIEAELKKSGMAVTLLPFRHGEQTFANIAAERQGSESPHQIIVVGAHYDSAGEAPGANDNATGVAALLVLARAFSVPQRRTLRFVAFANEEPPHFQTEGMGSLVYARQCKERNDGIIAMLSLETMGYYADAADTQAYPFPLSLFYPDTGNFIAFVGDTSSRELVHRVVRTFRGRASFPSEGAALPGGIPGVGWSDHWSFWQVGYPAVMVTDTAPFRYPQYHLTSDTPDKVDHERLARVVSGLREVLLNLANE